MIGVRLFAVGIAAAVALAAPGLAAADLGDEQALARKYAPVVRLVEQLEECGPGEPYEPLDVDLLFEEPTVAFRGPWNRTDLIEIGPTADDLVESYEHHLDFPGDPLDAGCTYELWARRLKERGDHEPTVYAHVATEAAHPGKLALQYWFFYPFNDFNNTHEGDWEMIQLVFDADDAAQALETTPTEVGYSSHEGAERAAWDDEDKLEVVDGTHPVVHPAAGSHANKFGEALYLGSSAEQGVGCDNTLGPHVEVRPTVLTIPSDPAAAREAYPWITFEGRWGELQPAFYNGPTGPNLKESWTEPITWSEAWRDRSYAVPTGGAFGTGATDFFCTAVARGSTWLTAALRNPVPMLILLGLVIGLVVMVVVKATWVPVAPVRVARRRSWGQILSSSARMYVHRPRLFIGIGLLLIPVSVITSLVQAFVFRVFEAVGIETSGETGGALVLVVLAIGAALTLFGFALVQAAIACALVEIDAGRAPHAPYAYRLAARRLRPLLGSVAIFVTMWVLLSSTAVLLPIAIWLAIRWCLVVQAVELDDTNALASIRRSATLVRRRWFRTGSLVGVGAALAILTGPLLGAVLIVLTEAPLAWMNIVAGVVYAVALPFVALVTSYVYLDARVRTEVDGRDPSELPAEIALGSPDPAAS